MRCRRRQCARIPRPGCPDPTRGAGVSRCSAQVVSVLVDDSGRGHNSAGCAKPVIGRALAE
jgi:hypothetical protein